LAINCGTLVASNPRLIVQSGLPVTGVVLEIEFMNDPVELTIAGVPPLGISPTKILAAHG
jgi:hypothetical protein